MRNILLSVVMVSLALTGCGGGGEDVYRQPGPGAGAGPGPSAATQLTVVTSAPSIPSDGSTTATVTAFARDASNNLLQGVPVTFEATSGGVSGSTGTTDANGGATATLSTAGDATVRTITVTARSGSLSANVNVQVSAGGGPSTTVQMGNGTGANFQAGIIGLSSANLAAGASTSLTAVLQQSDGSLYTQSAEVNFSSPCAAQGLATITNPVVTSTGIASATYAARGCSGADIITATATVGSTPVSATATVTVAAAAIGSIIFESATPANIALRGTGSATHPEVSTVIFRVLDQTGGPRVGTPVAFSLNTTVGGLSVLPTTATSDAQGRVQTVVQGGTVATSVRVTATVQGVTPVLATQSSQLTVTTGIPDQDSFSLAVECPNIESWAVDGVDVEVTARLSDRFNNPVPDGTAVTLQTEGGSIQSQCQTTNGLGACTVDWTSSNPRATTPPVGPELRRGRSTLLATAIGEETFVDTNGNGSFDNGESFSDLPERYMDENESDARDSFEPIYDFNSNSTYDAADGIFNGVLCLDTSGRCATNNTTTGISAQALIIMSDGAAVNLTPASGSTFILPMGQTRSFWVEYADLNGNPLPAGTTFLYSLTGNGLTLGQPAQFVMPCATEPGDFPITVSSAAGSLDGAVTVRIDSPRGIISVATFQIDVQ